MPAVRETAQPHLTPSPQQTPRYQETISGFTRYSNALKALPPRERSKIETLARRVLASHRQGQQPVRRIEIVGHADQDTPRRPAVEQRMSVDRALRVRTALAAVIDRLSTTQSSGLPLPPYSTRIQWDWSGAAASRLAVPSPRNEAERSRNRRVEITLTPLPRHRFTVGSAVPDREASSPMDAWKTQIESAIREFCARIGTEEINRDNCANAVNEAARRLGKSAPKGLNCNLVVGANFVDSKDYRSPIHVPPASLKCCAFNAPCDKEPYKSSCAHCAGALGPYLILKYGAVLANSVEKLRCALDRGCLAAAGVLSGICDDKPDAGCGRKTRKDLVWKECPEHWLLIIGFADDPSGRGNYTFVFWDSARMSPLQVCGHQFGLLYFNRSENRLSTAPTLAYMDVDKDGFHPWPYPQPQGTWYTQKRYQVLKLGVSGPYRAQTRAC